MGERRAPAAGVKEVKGVQDEAGGILLVEGLYFLVNGLGVQTLFDTLPGLADQEPDAGGQAAGVDDVHARHLLGSHDRILVGHGQAGAQGDMDHVKALVHQSLEHVLVIAHADRAGLGQGAGFLPVPVDHIVGDVDPVQILRIVHGDVEGNELHIIALL